MAARSWSLLFLTGATNAFVVTPDGLDISTLPGQAYRWTMPDCTAGKCTSANSTAGLGQGLAWAFAPDFCDRMVPRFPENEGMFGMVTFVSCTELKASVSRAFATWSDNHQLVSFVDVGDSSACSGATGNLNESCPWELLVEAGGGEEYPSLAAFVINYRASYFDSGWRARPVRSTAGVTATGVDQMQRSKMTIQTHHCWYLDATFCSSFSGMSDAGKLMVRLALFLSFACAMLYIFAVGVSIFACLFVSRGDGDRLHFERSPKRWSYSAAADYLSQLSPCVVFLAIFCCIFPLIFHERIFKPCDECYDFEAVLAHEAGHVLGFGHPDEQADYNMDGKCAVDSATCSDPFKCAQLATYAASSASIMHSITRVNPRTCLNTADLAGLHFLYPTCDGLAPIAPLCNKMQQRSGWLRLAIVVGVPLAITLLLTLLPLSFFHERDQRRLETLHKELEQARPQRAARPCAALVPPLCSPCTARPCAAPAPPLYCPPLCRSAPPASGPRRVACF